MNSVSVDVRVAAAQDGQLPCYVALLAQSPGLNYTLQNKTLQSASQVPNSAVILLTGSGNHNWARFQQRFDISTLVGCSRAEYRANVEDYAALVSAAPARVTPFEINVAPVTAASVNIEYHITVSYDVEFFDRIAVPDA